MLNNLNQFKWQITPNPNEKQREREREREIHKICSKKRKWKRKPGGADQLERGDRKSDGAKGWGVLRVLSPFASEVFFSSIPLLLPFLSLSLLLFSVFVCVCLCDSIFMYEWMYVFLPSFLCQNSNEGSLCLFDPSFPRGNPLSSYPHLHCLFPNYHPHPFYFIISYFLFNTVL